MTASDHALTPEDKLLFVSRQLDALQVEINADALMCPYCGTVTVAGEDFCCRTMASAVKILLDARDCVRAAMVARTVN